MQARATIPLLSLLLILSSYPATAVDGTVFRPPVVLSKGDRLGGIQTVVLGRNMVATYGRSHGVLDLDLFLRSSRNAGKRWRPPVNLSAKLGIQNRFYKLAGTPPSTLHLFWSGGRVSLYSRSEDLGTTWSKPERLSDGVLSVTANGDHVHAFGPGLQVGGYRRIQHFGSHDAGRSWSRTKTVSRLGDIVSGETVPRGAATGNTVYVAWGLSGNRRDEDRFSGVYVAVSYDAGANWADSIKLYKIPAPQQAPKPVPIARGDQAVVFFSQYPGCGGGRIEILYVRSEDRGLSWSEPECLARGRKNDAKNWHVSMDPFGRIHLMLYERFRGVLYQTSSDLGRTWSRPRVLRSDLGTDFFYGKALGVSSKRLLALLLELNNGSPGRWSSRVLGVVGKPTTPGSPGPP